MSIPSISKIVSELGAVVEVFEAEPSTEAEWHTIAQIFNDRQTYKAQKVKKNRLCLLQLQKVHFDLTSGCR